MIDVGCFGVQTRQPPRSMFGAGCSEQDAEGRVARFVRRAQGRLASGHSAYTRFVGLVWQRTIGAIVLSVFAGLPVSGMLCAAACAPSATAEAATADPHSHHANHAQRASASPSSELVPGQPAVDAPPGHDCTRHQGAAGETSPSLSAVRADADLIWVVQQQILPTAPHLSGLTSLRVHSGSSPPPGAASPTRAPLVLRI